MEGWELFAGVCLGPQSLPATVGALARTQEGEGEHCLLLPARGLSSCLGSLTEAILRCFLAGTFPSAL